MIWCRWIIPIQIVGLCIEKDGLGYQVFNAGNDTNGAIIPTKKIREVLGFKEEHDWRQYVDG